MVSPTILLTKKSIYDVTVTQLEKTMIRLKDGMPIHLVYEGNSDLNKHMILPIPLGNITLVITIKSLTKNFNPKLYFTIYDDIEKEIKNNKLLFPPLGA